MSVPIEATNSEKRAVVKPSANLYRTSKQPTNRRAQGIDISHYEGNFNPYASQIPLDFVIMKATEGGTFQDPTFNTKLQQSQPVPMKGAYHYIRSGIPVDVQVKNFLNSVAGKNLDFYAVDLEQANNVVNPLLAQQSRDFIAQVEAATGKPTFLYTNNSILEDYFKKPTDKNLKIWLSDPSQTKTDPYVAPGFNWDMWQSSYSAPASGLGITDAHAVDFNVYNGTPAQMAAMLKNTNPPLKLGTGKQVTTKTQAPPTTAAPGLSLAEKLFNAPVTGGQKPSAPSAEPGAGSAKISTPAPNLGASLLAQLTGSGSTSTPPAPAARPPSMLEAVLGIDPQSLAFVVIGAALIFLGLFLLLWQAGKVAAPVVADVAKTAAVAAA